MFQFAERKRAREAAEAQVRDWKTQEIAELYRVRDRLAEAGLSVALATGVSDEGDPWAVFEQMDTSEVVVHIARIDGELIVANAATGATYRGRDFRAVADGMLDGAPLALPRKSAGSNVVIHPRSVLTAFVAAAVVLAEVARSVEQAQAAEAQSREEVAETAAHDGFVALFWRVLNRDGNAPATFAGGVVFGAVAAAIIATTLAEPTETSADVSVASASTDVIADPSVASAVRVDAEGEPLRSRDDGADAQVADAPEGGEVDAVALVDLPNLSDATVGVETRGHAVVAERPAEAGIAVDSTHTATVHADEAGAEATPEPRRPAEAAGGETAATRSAASRSESAGSTPPPSSEGGTTTERGPALADVTRKVADSITVVKLDGDFDAAKAPNLIGSDKPIVIALASLDMLETGKGKAKAGGEVVLDVIADDLGAGSDGLLEDGAPGDLGTDLPEGPVAAPNPAPPLMNITFHDASFDTSQHAFMKGVIDVLLFTGGEARIDHFDFGEDLLVVDGGSSLVGWLKDVEVVGTDVKIVGVDGSVIWLNDSYHTIA
ncbi:hypothetical protein [Salinarimonas ramus]|uniref:Uncharacterized protein n=1 Tax=Salinarimonas ramus TaxID=690164 RepID=A0A917V7A3_9HYPH|nr:hypothetical protein [Salinarimonas ramus]GGK46900.1 hypothetical protein GCM10011322_37490 [Salinarimonas ramus]